VPLRLIKTIKTLLSHPPGIILQKCLWLVSRRWESSVTQKLDLFRPTYSHNFSRTAASLGSYLKKPPTNSLNADSDQILSLSDLYLNHTFDLLGSGWTQVRYGMDCRGLEGYRYSMGSNLKIDPECNWLKNKINSSNKDHSIKTWRMTSSDYTPIDWQLDFKSGYRWNEEKPASQCSPAPLPGVDIKVPWELSRMQHLTQLAWAYGLASQGVERAQPPKTYTNEFRNQTLDFIATNPPRFGVNWCSSMDVGIRVCNWLVAYDLFKTQGASFDPDFEQTFINSIYDHGRHIIHNLDWNPTFRNNHYLANILGLLYVSAYLPRSSETDTWLAFSVQELIRAMEEQFHPDGSNFEGSTCYHRLSAEMMLYGTALILGLPDSKRDTLKHYQPISIFPGLKLQKAPLPFFPIPGSDQASPLPPSHFKKLERIANFTRATLKPNEQSLQVGDNDNGRFLKINSKYNKTDWIEDHSNHSLLIKAIDVLFGKQVDSPEPDNIEARLAYDLAGEQTISSSTTENSSSDSGNFTTGSDSTWSEGAQKLEGFSIEQSNTYEIFSQGHNLKSGLKTISFPDFGLYLMVSEKMFLSIRCGPVGQNGNGGHAHNDALSIELQIDGIDHITDPGSYLYTPLPEIRNAYRSIKAHFAPRVDQREPNPIDQDLFFMEDRAQAQCLYFGDNGFIGMHTGYNSPVYRLIQVEDDRLVIKDGIDGPEKLVPLDPLNPTNGLPFSSGYGIRHS
jgi:Heparinase II/III-like protein/Heparinase II/III N-terminus